MTIAQYLRLLREQWVVVALLTLVGAVGAGTYSMLQTPLYQADAQLFVSMSGQSGNLGEMTQGGTFIQARVKSYTDLLTSPRLLAPVIRQLSLDVTPAQLAGRISATSPLETVLIEVTVTDTSPVRAADIANAVSTQFPALVNLLETPDRATASPVKVTVTRPAVPAGAPVSPRRSLNLALGLLVGLGLGIGAGVLRDSLDRTVGSRTQVSQIAGAPVLGSVAEDPDTTERPLITHDAFSARAEAFRQLRTNIRFLSVDHRVASLVVTGSVQGEGKTTTAVNAAIALAQSGEHVVLIDADLRRPTVADVFGLPGGIGLTSVLVGDAAVDDALQVWRDDLPLRVLTAGPLPPNPSELIGSARMADLIRDLTGRGATVVVASPPLLPVTDAAILARVTDGALIVTRVASTRVEQFTAAVESLRTAGAPILGLVLNRVPRRGRSSYYNSTGYGGAYQAQAVARAAGHPLATAGTPVAPAAGPPPMPAPAAPPTAPSALPGHPAAPAPTDHAGRRRPWGRPDVRPTDAAPLDAVLRPGPEATLLGAGPAVPPPAPDGPDLEVDLRDGAPAMAAPAAYAARSAYAQHLAGAGFNGYLPAGPVNGAGGPVNGTSGPVNGASGPVNGYGSPTIGDLFPGAPSADEGPGRGLRGRGRRSAPPRED